ncbi:hypothetical protein [Litorivivens sp.]
MSMLWLGVALLVTLHTAWTLAHAIVHKGARSDGLITPHSTAVFVWGGVVLLVLVQGGYLLVQL